MMAEGWHMSSSCLTASTALSRHSIPHPANASINNNSPVCPQPCQKPRHKHCDTFPHVDIHPGWKSLAEPCTHQTKSNFFFLPFNLVISKYLKATKLNFTGQQGFDVQNTSTEYCKLESVRINNVYILFFIYTFWYYSHNFSLRAHVTIL